MSSTKNFAARASPAVPDGSRSGWRTYSYHGCSEPRSYSHITQNAAASSGETVPNASALRAAGVSAPARSRPSSERESASHARGVENGAGVAGTGRWSELGA